MSGPATKPVPQSGILDIAAYVPGKSKGPANVKVHKLSSNETPLGASPAAIEAFRDVSSRLELYPDGGSTPLREAIAERYGLNADHIVCGAGSDELLSLIAQAYLGPGDEAVFTRHGFLVYEIAIRTNGATPVVAAETGYHADVDQILACVTDNTRVVFLANPNNPTGTYIPIDEVRRLHAGLPASTVLVIDAAYAEYVRRNDYEAGIELVSCAENVIMTRTFSKIYGLAGLRLGWAYAPAHMADVLNRIRGPFNVNAPAIAAGVAALGDAEHLEATIAHNSEWLERVTTGLRDLGLEVTPSVGNFVLIHFSDRDGKSAQHADAYLTERGLILRRLENYHLPNALRMTIGSREANEAVVAALSAFLSDGE